MALMILVSRSFDPWVRGHLGPVASDFYLIVRWTVTSMAMAALIAWLAFRHRREYEAKLTAHNVALESTRDFLARIIDGSAEAIVTLDPEDRFTSWNRSAEKIFGWRSEEILGRSVKLVLPPGPEAEAEFAAMEAVIRSGRPVIDHEARRVRKDGQIIDVRITRSPLWDAAGVFVGSTSIVRDVSALKNMEAKLVERERLAAVGELAASIAHEIKNPLAGIRGACEIMSDVLAPDDPRRELSQEVHRQIERLDRTLRDLLMFSRPAAMNPESASIHEILEHVLAVLLEDPQVRDVRVERRYVPELPDVRIDVAQMEQVFFNVIVNAVQAMDRRGRIVIETGFGDRSVEISVSDEGPGIPPEILDKIFKPFFTTRSKGSGLGLAIVRKIVEAHNGTIVASNRPGGGARFVVTLPREEMVAA